MRRSARIEGERRSASCPHSWLDVDPCQEAASLARMPSATAAMRLIALMAALPDGSTKRIGVKAIADEFVALLLKGKGLTVRPTDSLFVAVMPRKTQIRTVVAALFI